VADTCDLDIRHDHPAHIGRHGLVAAGRFDLLCDLSAMSLLVPVELRVPRMGI
jgi:hypothetical protein